MPKSLLIIPARSGSKRIKNKNIIKFFDKPIINYSIQTAIKSNLFNKIHVSTDSKKYVKLVTKQGISVDFMRPKRLSDDNTPIFEVVKYVVNKYKKKNLEFDSIFVLSACNPLVSVSNLKKGFNLFLKNKKKYPVMPVLRFASPIDWSLRLKQTKITPLYKNKLKIKSQNFKNYYYDSGSFCIFPKEYIYNNCSLDDFADKFVGFEISRFDSIDIDNEEDLKLAKALFYFKKNNK